MLCYPTLACHGQAHPTPPLYWEVSGVMVTAPVPCGTLSEIRNWSMEWASWVEENEEVWHWAKTGLMRATGAEMESGMMAPEMRQGQAKTWGEVRLGKGTGTKRNSENRNWDGMGWRGEDSRRERGLTCCGNQLVQSGIGTKVEEIKSLSQGWSNWSLLWKIQFCPYSNQKDPVPCLTCPLNQILYRQSLMLWFFF